MNGSAFERKIRVTVPGSWVVHYSYSEKVGARRRTIESTITVPAGNEVVAIAVATGRRGHLDKFKVTKVEADYELRRPTDAECAEIGRKQLEAIAKMRK